VLVITTDNVKKWEAFSYKRSIVTSVMRAIYLAIALTMLTVEVLVTLNVLIKDLIIVVEDTELYVRLNK